MGTLEHTGGPYVVLGMSVLLLLPIQYVSLGFDTKTILFCTLFASFVQQKKGFIGKSECFYNVYFISI